MSSWSLKMNHTSKIIYWGLLLTLLFGFIYVCKEFGPEYKHECLSRRCYMPPFHHTCFCTDSYYRKLRGWNLPIPDWIQDPIGDFLHKSITLIFETTFSAMYTLFMLPYYLGAV